jgi:hypothetical protein
MTSNKVISGADGSMPRSFSATTTCAELDTGSNSVRPWITARIITYRTDIPEP